MSFRHCLCNLCLVSLFTAGLLCPRPASAHEGHAALPAKGLTVVGDELLLSEGARKAIDIATSKVTLANLARTVECNARVELPWSQQAIVTTLVPGRVTHVLVRPGDRVTAGQELARIESLELESLQLAMLQADAQSAYFREQFSRRSPLASQGVIAGREAMDAERSLRQKTAELEVALCKLRGLGLPQPLLDDVRNTRRPVRSFSMVSPISGTIAHVDVRVGGHVKTTEHLFHVVDPSTLWVTASVIEGDMVHVRKGQSASVSFTSLPDQSYRGTIDSLRLSMNETTRTRDAVMVLENPTGVLRPGLFGRMAIRVEEAQEAIVVAEEAIIRDAGSTFVLLNRGEGTYVRQPVRLGLRHGRQVEVLDGLFPGDQVVITGTHVLYSLFGDRESSSIGFERIQADDDSPERSQVNEALVVRGVVEMPTDRKAFAGSRAEGRIGRILIEHGQSVQAGQVLADVESLEVRNLQGELLDTDVQLSWTRQQVGRLMDLVQQHIPSRRELWQLQAEERALSVKRESLLQTLSMHGIPESDLEQVLATDLSSAECDLNLVRSIPIRAPISGNVVEFDILPGQIVDGQSALFEVHDASTVWVKGYVFQQDAWSIQEGQSVSVRFAARPETRVEGRVVRMSPMLDSSERVLPFWVEVENTDGQLIEGMWARMEIVTPEQSPTPVATGGGSGAYSP